MPHWSTLPQPSPAIPHSMPCIAHVLGQQPKFPHTPMTPHPPQLNPFIQLPQSFTPPHPSDCIPQLKPSSAQVFGQQAWAGPQTPGFPVHPPPHTCPAGHVPQFKMPPQPSACVPH